MVRGGAWRRGERYAASRLGCARGRALSRAHSLEHRLDRGHTRTARPELRLGCARALTHARANPYGSPAHRFLQRVVRAPRAQPRRAGVKNARLTLISLSILYVIASTIPLVDAHIISCIFTLRHSLVRFGGFAYIFTFQSGLPTVWLRSGLGATTLPPVDDPWPPKLKPTRGLSEQWRRCRVGVPNNL